MATDIRHGLYWPVVPATRSMGLRWKPRANPSGNHDLALVVDAAGFGDSPTGTGRQQGVQVLHVAVLIEENRKSAVRGSGADDLAQGIDSNGGCRIAGSGRRRRNGPDSSSRGRHRPSRSDVSSGHPSASGGWPADKPRHAQPYQNVVRRHAPITRGLKQLGFDNYSPPPEMPLQKCPSRNAPPEMPLPRNVPPTYTRGVLA